MAEYLWLPGEIAALLKAPTSTGIRRLCGCGEWTYAATCLPCRQPVPGLCPRCSSGPDNCICRAARPTSLSPTYGFSGGGYTVEPVAVGTASYGTGRRWVR